MAIIQRLTQRAQALSADFAWKLTACVCLAIASGCGGSAESQPGTTPAAVETPQVLSGQQLFARHCAACHGETGDGKGIAAAFMFPKPRDFRAGRFRLVSTTNRVPLREDLHAVLLRGMPGSAMPPWSHLSPPDREKLVDEVLRLRQAGAADAFLRQLKEEEGLTDEEIAADGIQKEIRDYMTEAITPGETTDVPTITPPSNESIDRGKALYARFACIQCHGATGRGDGVQAMMDDEKMPTRPRDFTLGIFKGNHDAESLYRRIAYGMPGTPMPSSSGMTPDQMADLVHYIRSLSSEEQRQAAILKREKIIAKRVPQLPNESDQTWGSVTPVELRATPLWWGSQARGDVELRVQAVHDGSTLAVRVSWPDPTCDQHALRSEAFEDAVAMELYRGESEPFLGMGDASAPVDVWFWDADRQSGIAAFEEANPNAVVDIFPFNEDVVEGPELSRPGGRMMNQLPVSLPALAAGNQIVPTSDESGGSELHVGGPGSVTFRIPKNQQVNARGVWRDGWWNVVMQRPLSVPEGGVSLATGARASVAFAIWDGAKGDRNGQKAFTIWQDLELER